MKIPKQLVRGFISEYRMQLEAAYNKIRLHANANTCTPDEVEYLMLYVLDKHLPSETHISRLVTLRDEVLNTITQKVNAYKTTLRSISDTFTDSGFTVSYNRDSILHRADPRISIDVQYASTWDNRRSNSITLLHSVIPDCMPITSDGLRLDVPYRRMGDIEHVKKLLETWPEFERLSYLLLPLYDSHMKHIFSAVKDIQMYSQRRLCKYLYSRNKKIRDLVAKILTANKKVREMHDTRVIFRDNMPDVTQITTDAKLEADPLLSQILTACPENYAKYTKLKTDYAEAIIARRKAAADAKARKKQAHLKQLADIKAGIIAPNAEPKPEPEPKVQTAPKLNTAMIAAINKLTD